MPSLYEGKGSRSLSVTHKIGRPGDLIRLPRAKLHLTGMLSVQRKSSFLHN